ncbi:hypothetical protein Pfo_007719 [Paulownia fortunei]|nr:hypothetical protein Pfo_007719 [Paulownia fortunei]
MQVKCFMQQLLSGLQHCHERGILVRGMTSSNLLIDKNGMLKSADFKHAHCFGPNSSYPLARQVGGLWYRAPEILLGSKDYGVDVDLWSAGCIFGELFLGRPIMPGRTEVEQLFRTFKLCGSPGEFWTRLKIPTFFRLPYPSNARLHEASANSLIQHLFFSTSPLSCGLSGLPTINMEEADATQSNDQTR